MNILLITPAAADSRSGNRTSAVRWAKIFRHLGHQVTIATHYDKQTADMLVALHAWRSADAITQFTDAHPQHPCIVVLTGTDIYRFIHSHPNPTLSSIQRATLLVGINALAAQTLPHKYRDKVRIIFQSTHYLPPRPQNKNGFKVCVAGHLRHEKDSLRPAYAVRTLPKQSQISIQHFGKAHSIEWAKQARLETARNARYQWHGEHPTSELFGQYAKSRLFVLPSRMEGGANVVSEAIQARLPIVASRIDGNVGLLGEDYPGYFEVENTQELRNILLKAEQNKHFYSQLERACRKKQRLFSQSNERQQWQRLFAEIS